MSLATLSDVRGSVLLHLGVFRPRCGCWWAIGNERRFSGVQAGVIVILHPQRRVEVLILPLFILSSLLLLLYICN